MLAKTTLLIQLRQTAPRENDFYHDMGECPDEYESDRINANGNYEPGNCRWLDRKTQARNRCNRRRVTFDRETRTIVEWAEITGIRYSTLWDRLFAYKWSPERAFTVPVGQAGLGESKIH